MATDLDIARDVPAYRIYRNGVASETVTDVADEWRDDLVTFALGCSFTFEHALMQSGLNIRHIEQGRNVPMYQTSVPLTPAGGFKGNLVVSMRPFLAADVIRAVQITTRYPQVHGSPVHLGNPALIGISDLDSPDYGDAVSVGENEIPVFWACGVTPSRYSLILVWHSQSPTAPGTCWSRIFRTAAWPCSNPNQPRRRA